MSECICFVTPEHMWFYYGSAVELGSQMEPNPECPVHFPKNEARIFWDGDSMGRLIWHCLDCLATGSGEVKQGIEDGNRHRHNCPSKSNSLT